MIQKVTIFFFILLGIFWKESVFAQFNTVPNDNCKEALILCLQGFIGNTKGLTVGKDSTSCNGELIQNPGPDGWIAFRPLESNIEFYVQTLLNKGKMRAYIHSDCDSAPIDCSGLCDTLSKVGKNIVFTPGATYYLRIEACEGQDIPYKINYSPDGNIITPPDAINPKWTGNFNISGPSKLDCQNTIASYELLSCPPATAYNWTIDGDAEIINDFGNEYIDNNPIQPGTSVTITGDNRRKVRVMFNVKCPLGDTIKLCCEGTNGCYNTGGICKTIIVKCPSNDNKSVILCPQDSVWIDPNGKISGAFLPGSPCGTPREYTVTGLNDQNCTSTFVLKVTKNCNDFGLIESFDNSPIKSCENTVKAAVPAFTVFSGGDYVYFITDSINNGSFGTIYERNQTGDFSYSSSYIYNKTYYIVFAIGEKAPEYVNLKYNCLRYSYQPLTFFKKPTISCIQSLPVVCANSVKLSATNNVGVGKWVLLSQVSGSNASFSDIYDSTAIFSVDKEGVYRLQWNVDNQVCITTCETELTFKKEGPKAEKTKYTCNASGTSYTVSIKLNGIAPMKVLKGSSKGLLIGNTFTSFPIVAGKPYYLFVKDGQNCDTLKLSGTYLCPEYNGDLLNVEEREQIEEDIQFSLQPNPAKDVLQLQWNGILEGQTGKLELVDMTGRVVQSVVISAQEKQYQMDVRTLSQGNYIVRILFGDVFLQEKLMIMKE